MGSMGIELGFVLGEDHPQVRGVDDEDPVEDLAAHAAYPALHDRVRSGRPDGRLDDPNALSLEHRVESVGELSVPVTDQERELARPVAEVEQQVAGLLGRATCRRNTASWWRSTRISMSLDRSDRPSSTSQPRSRTKIRYSSRRATRPDPADLTVGSSAERRTPGHGPQPSSRHRHGRCPGQSAGGRACADCSCHTCSRPVCGARPAVSRASRGRSRSSARRGGAVPARRTTPSRPRVTHSADLAAQHCVLVPEHQQLCILRPVPAEHQDGHAQCPARQQVHDLEQHLASQPAPRQACWR